MTTVRRVSAIMMSSFYDETVTPGVIRISATVSYELMYLGEDGKQIAPAKPDGQVYVTDEELVVTPHYQEVYALIRDWALALAHKRDAKIVAEAEAFKKLQAEQLAQIEERNRNMAAQAEMEKKKAEEEKKAMEDQKNLVPKKKP